MPVWRHLAGSGDSRHAAAQAAPAARTAGASIPVTPPCPLDSVH